MRVIIHRVLKASVMTDREVIGKIEKGLFLLVGIKDTDTIEDIKWLCSKIVNMRIFQDQNRLMNLSVNDISGEILIVSQFTLYASTKKGNRPSFTRASKPQIAKPLYEVFVSQLQTYLGKQIQTGLFGAMMEIELTNDGPVTIIIDSQNRE